MRDERKFPKIRVEIQRFFLIFLGGIAVILLEISAIFLPLIEQDLQKFQLFNERKTGYLRAKFDERLRKIYANFVEILAIFLGAL